MYISSIIIKNFRCFGEASTTIYLDKDITFFVGNNGSGKTTVFTALKRLFGESREDRTIVKEDFHLKPNETIDNAQDREMFIDVIFTFPEVATSDIINSILPGFEHVIYSTSEGSFKAKIRLEAKWTSNEYDDEVESKLYWITTDSEIGFGDDFENKTIVTNQERKVIQLRYIPAFRHSNAILKNNIQHLIKIITDYVDINEETSISGESSKEDEIKLLNDKLREEIKEISALKEIKNLIDKNWIKTHDDALKYINQAVLAHPELYFAKLVILGEGDYSKYKLFECDLTDDLLKKYRYLFCSKSKVSSHYLAIEEIIKLDTLNIESKCPKRIKALINKAKDILYSEERNAY